MNNDDLISRQAAIEYFMTNTNWHDEDGYPIDDAEEKRKLLEDYFNGISSAEPSCSEIPKKTGHWIEDAKTYYEELKKRSLGVDEYTPYFTDDIACSECLAKYSVLDNETQFFKYCPNCGARMEVEE